MCKCRGDEALPCSSLPPPPPPQALHEQMAASVQEISNLIEPVAIAARSEASQLGHKVRPYSQGAVT